MVQPEEGQAQPGREVFQWAPLNAISNYVYSPKASKALSAMGAANLGMPTVLAANGLICVGTETGFICVFDFAQNLKCLCGKDAVGEVVCLTFPDVILIIHHFRRERWGCNLVGTIP